MSLRMRWDHLRAAFAGEPSERPSAAVGRGQEQALSETGTARALLRGTGGIRLTRWDDDELLTRRGLGVYREMLEDEQVSACLDLTRAAITQRNWDFELEDETVQEPVAAALRHNMTRTLQGTFGQLMGTCLTHRVEGFALVEKVYSSALRGPGGAPWWGLARFALREASSIEFEVDVHGNLIALRQRAGAGQDGIVLDPWRFILHVHRPELKRWQGVSALKPVFKHYWAKKNIYNFWNIYLERVGGGLAAAKLDKDATLPDADRTSLETLMRRLSSAAGLILPRGVTLELLEPQDNQNFSTAIEQRDMAIAKALLLPNLLGYSPQGKHGSLAQADKQMEAYWLVLNDYADALADTLNEQLFRELVIWNFGAGIAAPLFRFNALSWEQRRDVSQAFLDLLKGSAARKTFEDEVWLRAGLGAPPRERGAADDEDELPTEVPGEDEPPSEMPRENAEIGTPLGENPLDSAQGLARARLHASALTERRVDLQRVKDELYGRLLGEYEHAVGSAARTLFDQLAAQVRAGALPSTLALTARDEQEMLRVHRTHLDLVFRFGSKEARDELQRAGAPGGRPTFAVSDARFAALDVLDYVRERAFFATRMLTEEMVGALRAVLLTGLRDEKPVEAIVAEGLRALAPLIPEEPVEGRAAVTPPRIATAVRTVTTDMFNAARRATFEDPELGGFVQAYEYSAVLDERTTTICRELDGKVWPVGSTNWTRYTPPNHFNCRSLLVPLVKGDEWTASPDELPSGAEPAPGFG